MIEDKLIILLINYWTTPFNFFNAIVDGVFVSMVLSFFILLYSFFLKKHKLIPVNINGLDVRKTAPTSTINNEPTVGLSIKLPICIQNIGSKPTEEIEIIYEFQKTSSSIFTSSGISRQRKGSWIYPGKIGDFLYDNVLNIKPTAGCIIFQIQITILPRRGEITTFEIEIFINSSHDSIKSAYIKNIKKLNRFLSYMLRHHKNKKIIRYFILKNDIIKQIINKQILK